MTEKDKAADDLYCRLARTIGRLQTVIKIQDRITSDLVRELLANMIEAQNHEVALAQQINDLMSDLEGQAEELVRLRQKLLFLETGQRKEIA